MVDITSKAVSLRTSKAIGYVVVPSRIRHLIDPDFEPTRHSTDQPLVKNLINQKGNPLIVAQIAGIQAAKRTSELIPLCHHSIPITAIDLQIEIIHDQIHSNLIRLRVQCITTCQAQTGIEMESLTGVSVACLTLWDMLKADCGQEMIIEGIRVIEKSGGKNDFSIHSP